MRVAAAETPAQAQVATRMRSVVAFDFNPARRVAFPQISGKGGRERERRVRKKYNDVTH